jgi:hypothetical protein
VVLCFTDETADRIRKSAVAMDQPSAAGAAFRKFRTRVRRRGHDPRSLVEALLGGEDIANVDADILDVNFQAATPPGHIRGASVDPESKRASDFC